MKNDYMIKFGVSGNSNSFYEDGFSSTIDAAKWCKSKGLDLYEYSFGRGIKMRDQTAVEIGNEFKLYNIEMSVHAPYYINFANSDPQKIQNSLMYVINSLEKAKFLQAPRVVFHTASQGKMSREEAFNLTKLNIMLLMEKIAEKGYTDFILCPETMGKVGQIGTVEEIIEICNMAPYFYPCVDFGHINARERGILNTKKDYQLIIDKLLDNLPSQKVKYMHIHFSKIEYGERGEIRHLTFEDKKYGPEFEPLAEVLYKNTLQPHILSESDGTQAEDAMEMKKIYMKMLSK
ncbi:MAG: TIM barrel protein [Christensenellales bacterium]|jgi:deoxyribonuclease-4|nr:TIM barrel protein [Clostridiales bacterium]